MKIKNSFLTVSDIEIFAAHGALEQERNIGNEFRVSVTVYFDAKCAMEYDDLEHTVNYANIVEVVRRIMGEPSILIENVAYRLIKALCEAFPIVESGTVSVTKVHPPISIPNGGATFSASFDVK